MLPLTDLDGIIWISDGIIDFASFGTFDANNVFYYGHIPDLPQPTLPEISNALEKIDDNVIYPKISHHRYVKQASGVLQNVFIKQPPIYMYDISVKMGTESIPNMFLHEIKIIQELSKTPHEGIIQYHGCRVERGYITGIVLEKPRCSLKEYVFSGASVDKRQLMKTIAETVERLHASGFSRFDLNPNEIMVDSQGNPVIANFALCRKVVGEQSASGGAPDSTRGVTVADQRLNIGYDNELLGVLKDWLDPTLE